MNLLKSMGTVGLIVAGVLFVPAQAAPVEETAVLQTATGELHGTLLVPAGAGFAPVVFIHPGSGPTDRDGNNPGFRGPNDSLKQLAAGLAAAGVASLRVDKRGIAGSRAAGPAREEDLTFGVYVADTVAWARQLRESGRFSRLVLAGHSEGALIVSEAARIEAPDALVLMAGIGRPMGAVLREQLAGRLPPALAVRSEEILAKLERGETSADVPAPLASLFRPSVQPYLVSVLGIDPVVSVAATSCPVLVVQGETDLQVKPADARLLAGARPMGAELLLLDGANHLFKPVSGDLAAQLPSYGRPDPALDARLSAAVARFAAGPPEVAP